METSEFFSHVLGDDGFYCIFAVNGETKVRKQKFYTTKSEALYSALQLDANGFDTYFALATFEDGTSRTAANAAHFRALFLDLDCGPGKDFADQSTALVALRKFGKKLKLPRPMVVDSGRGLHVYWPFMEAVSAADWLPVAKALKRACAALDFGADPGVTADAARVLRVPGTHNYKDDPARPVRVLGGEPVTPTTLAKMRDCLSEYAGRIQAAPTVPALAALSEEKRMQLNAATQRMHANSTSSFKKILKRSFKGTGCEQIRWAAANQADTPEPLWWGVLSVAQACEDRAKAIHAVSQEHPGYDPEVTETKAARTGGPFKCATFNDVRPGVCEGCPHWGKIAGPIMLGRKVKEAEPELEIVEPDETSEDIDTGAVKVEQRSAETQEKRTYTIPPYPEPFFRGAHGGIYRREKQKDDDGNIESIDVPVYLNDFYYSRRIFDPDDGETLLARLHLPHDGVREFLLPLTKATSKEELRRALSNYGVSCNHKEWDQLMTYTNTWTNHLQSSQAADVARRQFGWTSPEMTSFIMGDREIFGDRVEYNPPSSKTAFLFPAFEKRGTLEGWKETANFYNRTGMEMYQFVVALALASPLVAMTPANAAVFLMHTEDSGFGKTTTQQFAFTAFAGYERFIGKQKDTDNSRMNRVELLKNIPYMYDEATNKSPQEASDFIYTIHAGAQKTRMKSSANEERAQGEMWKLSVVMSANQSLVAKVMMQKEGPKAEIQRILEYEPTRFGFTSKSETDAFQQRVGKDAGHAAEPFIQYIIENREEVKTLLDSVQKRIDKACNLKAENRYWSITASVALTGALIAKEIGLVQYDIAKLFDWTIDMIRDNQRRDAAVQLDGSTLLSEYVAENYNNILWIKSTEDLRTAKHGGGMDSLVTPEQLPRGKLVARYETDLKRLFLVTRPFQKWCSERQINYDALVKRMAQDMPVETKKARLSKGTKLNLPPMNVLVVNCKNLRLDIDEDEGGDAS